MVVVDPCSTTPTRRQHPWMGGLQLTSCMTEVMSPLAGASAELAG